MSLSSKFTLAVAIAAGGTLAGVGGGTAQAAGAYGAMATDYSQVFDAVDYPTQEAANQAALQACGKSYCVIKLELKNSCGSAVELPNRGWWGLVPGASSLWWGTGATAADAEQMALSQAPFPLQPWAVALQAAWGSTVTSAPFVKQTACTSSAR
ncbi:DUF4189 domain-containing protein [Nocardia yamanashiensis]|uniref:DUF4189 domain-containing protein n=1 Tax=Nocardia yamanashiensis TaxID=209247 RepID=UPI00082B8240|nr:DUF4189 domain-containing protein [Nocardia yamanashiensis]